MLPSEPLKPISQSHVPGECDDLRKAVAPWYTIVGMAKRKTLADYGDIAKFPKLGTFLEPELLNAVKEKAAKRGVSASTYVHDLLAREMKFEPRAQS